MDTFLNATVATWVCKVLKLETDGWRLGFLEKKVCLAGDCLFIADFFHGLIAFQVVLNFTSCSQFKQILPGEMRSGGRANDL